MSALRDDVAALLEPALEEPSEGHTLWSFHVKDRAEPLEEDEIVERVTGGAGVYVVELVYDAALELMQRGTGKKLKSASDVRAFRRERLDAMAGAPLPPRAALGAALGADSPRLRAPAETKARRTTPLHGALLDAPTRSRDKPARKR